MRIIIIADIHGKYESLKELLKLLNPADAMVNLGDVAGFTSCANDCYKALNRKNTINILGNHELEVLSDPSDAEEDFEILDDAGNALAQDFGINDENKSFVKTFKKIAKIELDGLPISFCHGYMVKTGSGFNFEYLSEDNLANHYKKFNTPFTFCGHIHIPQIIEMGPGEYPKMREIRENTSIPLLDGMVYGFNAGMLSRSKDDAERLHYVVLDTLQKEVEYVFA